MSPRTPSTADQRSPSFMLRDGRGWNADIANDADRNADTATDPAGTQITQMPQITQIKREGPGAQMTRTGHSKFQSLTSAQRGFHLSRGTMRQNLRHLRHPRSPFFLLRDERLCLLAPQLPPISVRPRSEDQSAFRGSVRVGAIGVRGAGAGAALPLPRRQHPPDIRAQPLDRGRDRRRCLPRLEQL